MLPESLISADVEPNVRLIGAPRIETGSLVTAHFRSNRVLALLGYLCLRPGEAVPREEIADRLWPTLSPEASRNNLRVTLLYLRQALEAHGLERALDRSDRLALGLDENIIVSDLSLYRSARLTPDAALRLSEGTLLPSLYDEWVEEARRELSASRIVLLIREGAAKLQKEPRRALEFALAALAEDAFAEDAMLLATQARLALGESAEATRELLIYRRRLQEETGAELSPALAQALEKAETNARPALRRPTAIPTTRTRFYGRQVELTTVEAWAREPFDRVLTVCGPGGIGKSRLGAEAAKALENPLWIDATGATTGEALLDLVASAVSQGQVVPGRALDHVEVALLDRPTVLVLDNLEQIPDEGLAVVDELLSRLPQARALCLSRKTLGLPGERILTLGPLPLPRSADDREAPALALFLDRADARLRQGDVDPDLFRLSRELEGIPLAIELAAAKTTSFGVRELVEGMSARLDLLVGRDSIHARHRTMRAALDWSFDLLEKEEREAIATLAVLKNDWTLAAAGALTSLQARETVELACANSLASRAKEGAESRYSMLECTREYALETMAPSRIERARAQAADYFLEIAGQGLTLQQLEIERPNLEAALEFFSEAADRIERLLDLGELLERFWTETGAGRTALRTLQGIDRSILESDPRARLELLETRVHFSISDFENAHSAANAGLVSAQKGELRAALLAFRSRTSRVLGRIEEATDAARQAIAAAEDAPAKILAEALVALVGIEIAVFDPGVLATAQRGVAAAEASGDLFLLSNALETLSLVYFRLAEFDLGEAAFLRMDHLPIVPTSLRQARRWVYRAQIDVARGKLAEAAAAYEVGLAHARVAAQPWWLGQALAQLGDTYNKLGRYADAREAHEEASAIPLRTHDDRGLASCLRGLGMASFGLGEYGRAVEELTRARAYAKEVGDEFLFTTMLMPLAKAALASGGADEARTALAEAIEVGERLQAHGSLARELDLPGLVEEAKRLLNGLHH